MAGISEIVESATAVTVLVKIVLMLDMCVNFACCDICQDTDTVVTTKTDAVVDNLSLDAAKVCDIYE